mmetsp:Transcript_13217/g.15123  ORF Transcript_13217/g.15123 Transcript_13217/m.15123 type:complete len:210 (-) Transcript_13217:90-719(-)|eukprot:CAMPEP_0184021964 /NCGR_PEP_ID=MMETSP0954-20121128/10273_1 /TAXON_ID=627963 /ORGANISM="Aplanochytrium sp, Strain PBS07" /LENGTH=209 /DNA_ID=CAMNT_0026304147 /DNA_START=179 /DNA_END=808 /DNA_ORIENTATION=+
MPSLYFTPTSCGAASFIAAKRGGIEWDRTEIVDLATHTLLGSGKDFYSVNPKGNVPTISLEDGDLLNENVGTLYWIGKNSTKNNLLGEKATDEFKVVNLLGYVASEVHKAFGPFFAGPDEEERKKLTQNLNKKLEFVEKELLEDGKKKFLVGESFTVADSYLYIVLTWAGYLKLELPEKLKAYRDNIGELSFVKEAHAAMSKIAEDAKA